MTLACISMVEWAVLLDDCGYEVVERYGWFDRRPFAGGRGLGVGGGAAGVKKDTPA